MAAGKGRAFQAVQAEKHDAEARGVPVCPQSPCMGAGIVRCIAPPFLVGCSLCPGPDAGTGIVKNVYSRRD